MTNIQITNEKGVSLLEILVVTAIFAILGIITTRAVLLTIGGSKKTESLIKVRENLSNSMGIIERQLRNADSIVECPNSDSTVISYVDQQGNTTSFSCVGLGTGDPYVASGSARLTSNQIKITGCSFTCVSGGAANPSSVSISLDAQDAGLSGLQSAKVSTSTQIFLRNY